MTNIKFHHQIETELLIVGAGIAGLACCVEAKAKGLNPILISKSIIGGGASFFPLKATLGIQITGDSDDKILFQQEIERVACGVNNPKIVRAYVEESPQAIELLSKIGFTPWLRQDNRPACFAYYTRPIYLINNWKQSAKRAKQILIQHQIEFYENSVLLHIVTEQNQIKGAIFAQQKGGEIRYIFCYTNNIILATGGIAGLYQDNLYPADIIGSTHYVAYQAGAKLTNLEFIQFIPAFVKPKYKVLFGEHTLKYLIKVTDSKGKNLFSHLSPQQFQKMIRQRSSYAPFSVDFQSVEFDLVIMKHLIENPTEKGVYLHYSPELYHDKTEFYQVYLTWLEKEMDIHLLRDQVIIRPFAHSCNGGIEINEYAQTAVQGLFAVGEVSACIEGANRLGGNSVGGSLVFAKRAIQKVVENVPHFSTQNKEHYVLKGIRYLQHLANQEKKSAHSSSEILRQVRSLMNQFANVYRTKKNLQCLITQLQHLEKNCPIDLKKIHSIEIYHAIKTAQLVVHAMINRKQSLGSHQISLKE
ncbi:FAD-binding protein [Histophilus somni]|uniref:FAD-binding protein n=1 Tax=Histophilus somni TaxID=731 RepID=UPI00094B10FC|nr:FAD-binding protein [Histophilus somni]